MELVERGPCIYPDRQSYISYDINALSLVYTRSPSHCTVLDIVEAKPMVYFGYTRSNNWVYGCLNLPCSGAFIALRRSCTRDPETGCNPEDRKLQGYRSFPNISSQSTM